MQVKKYDLEDIISHYIHKKATPDLNKTNRNSPLTSILSPPKSNLQYHAHFNKLKS